MRALVLFMVVLECFALWAMTSVNPAAINMVIGVGIPLVLLSVPMLWTAVMDRIDEWAFRRR